VYVSDDPECRSYYNQRNAPKIMPGRLTSDVLRQTPRLEKMDIQHQRENEYKNFDCSAHMRHLPVHSNLQKTRIESKNPECMMHVSNFRKPGTTIHCVSF
jgi:hypothetical protein